MPRWNNSLENNCKDILDNANPNIYPPNFINPRTKIKAVDKWEIDRIKLQYARDQSYEVLVVWESDFKKNKEEIIKQCIQFLTQ
jgi:hypothetical protein